MRTTEKFSFKNLLTTLRRGEPLDTRRLNECGLQPSHAAYLASHGWLVRLGRGVYMLPGDTLDRDACLALIAKDTAGFHVAGKTALAWRGVRHNLSFVEKLVLWSDKRIKLQPWFTERFPCRYQATHIFDDSLPAELGLAPLPNGRPDVLVSTPERALLELLSDVGKWQTLEETRNLVENVRNLRVPLMDELLAHVTRIKIVRLAHALADELNLPWLNLAQKHSDRLGGGQRWIAVGSTGERLDLVKKKK